MLVTAWVRADILSEKERPGEVEPYLKMADLPSGNLT